MNASVDGTLVLVQGRPVSPTAPDVRGSHRAILRLTYLLTPPVIALAVAARVFFHAPVSLSLILSLGAIVLGITYVQDAALRAGHDTAWLPPLHMVLILAVLTVGIAYSGGVQSPLVWVYALSVAIQGALRSRRWALASASVSTAMVVGATLLVRRDLVPFEGTLWPELSASIFLLSYAGMFYTVALTTAALGDRLRRQTAAIAGLASELHESYLGTVRALSDALDVRDASTSGHAWRVERWAVGTARALGLPEPEVEQIRFASLLHDVGKIGVPDAVLNKPATLTRDELVTMQEHALKGAMILEAAPFLREAAVIVRHHHERWDGAGYPNGLADVAIPLGSRIIAVVDAYEAMTAGRVYRGPVPPIAAAQELRASAGSQFDPRVVETFLSLVERDADP